MKDTLLYFPRPSASVRLTPFQAAQQKRQAEELARPRPRTCPSEEAISKAKAMACHRPSVAFGISYRGEMQQDLSYGDDGCMPPASRTMANEPPPAPLSPGKQYHHLQMQQRQEDELFGASADSYRLRGEVDGGGAVREENDAVRLGDTLGCREMMSRERAPQDDRFLRQAHQGGSDAPASRLPSSTWSTVGGVDGGDDRTLPVPTMTSKQGEDEGLLMSNDGDSGARECVTEALEGRGGGPGAELTTIRRTHELVDSWLLDVRLETETAGTALRVSATASHLCPLRASVLWPKPRGQITIQRRTSATHSHKRFEAAQCLAALRLLALSRLFCE